MNENKNQEQYDFRKFADAMDKAKSMLEEKRVRENPPEFEKFDKLIEWMNESIKEFFHLGFIREKFVILFPASPFTEWVKYYLECKYNYEYTGNQYARLKPEMFFGIIVEQTSPENSVFIYVKDTFPVVSRKFDLVENGFIKKESLI